MKTALLFWLWWQWKKYLQYFLKNNFFVHWVCQTQKTKEKIEENYQIKVFLDSEHIDILYYDLIVLALPPDIQWEKALKLLELWFQNKMIIEIPVSFNQEIIEKLQKYENVFFFLEEYFTKLGYFLRKIDVHKIKNIKINIFTNKADDENLQAREVTFLHLKSNFLWLWLHENIFQYFVNFHEREDIFYEIEFFYQNLKIMYFFKEKKYLKIGEKVFVDDFNFDNILKKYLVLEKNNNEFYKLNFTG